MTTDEIPAHTHLVSSSTEGGNYMASITPRGSLDYASSSTGGGSGHTHTVATADNVPAYVQVVVFQKD